MGASIRLSLWPDGVLWFCACRAQKQRGWEYEIRFHGLLESADVDGVRDMIEASIALIPFSPYSVGDPNRLRSQLLEVWAVVAPEPEA